MQKPVSRRFFIKRSLGAAAGLALSAPLETLASSTLQKRSLSFYHAHTKQQMTITYAYGKWYDAIALEYIDQFLSDFRTGDIHSIDPHLLDILWNVQSDIGRKGVFEVLSGYRSPATNRMLRKKTSGVAKNSLHMEGRAIDIRFSGASTRSLQRCAIAQESGGVGYYRRSNFVHLDTGDFRTW